MHPTVRLGRVAGIPIGAHWSVLAILALVTDMLATAILPASVKDSSAAANWVVGALVAVAFFACLLAHEAAHAIVARRHGVQVKSITLWMLGGVTQLEGNPPDARSDFRIAVSGPAVSMVCAVASGLGAAALVAVHAPRVAVAGLFWLAFTNGLLALFNMLPGAPLDGGRVLRAVIWRRTGDRTRAALAAGRAGRVTGLLLVGLGALQSLATADLLSGLWLVLIGWFLMASATAEMQATVSEVTLGDLTVGDVMQRDVIWLPAYQQAEVAARRAVQAGGEFFPVCDMDGRPVGIVHVERLVLAARSSELGIRVADVAAPIKPAMIAHPDERIIVALQRSGIAQLLLVMDDGQLVGLVTPADVNRARRRGLLQAGGATKQPVSS